MASSALPNPTTLLNNFVLNKSDGSDFVIPAADQTGQTTRLYRLLLVAGGATNITIKDSAGSGPAVALTGPIPLLANGAIVLDYTGEPWWMSSASSHLIISSSAAVQISGSVGYVQS